MYEFFVDFLNNEEITYLEKNTVFNKKEIIYLFERFGYLDREKSGGLGLANLDTIPEFAANPFKPLIMNYIEENITHYEKINFAYFLDFLKIFHHKTSKSARINFLFNVFDLNKDHKLFKGVLENIQKIIGIKSDPKSVNEILTMYDIGQKGHLDILDFTRLYNEDPDLERNMILDFESHIPKDERRCTVWDILWNDRYD